MKEKVIDATREKALGRFALIAPLIEEGLSACEQTQRRMMLLQKEDISERTLRRWIALYREDGFNGLVRKERMDKGSNKSIPPEALALAEQYRRELPGRSAKLLCEILAREGFEVARSTLERHLRLKGLSGKQLASELKGSPQTRRFVRVGRNTLWQTDLKYGPYLPNPNNPKKKLRTYLLAIIDDATRAVVHAEFYFDQKLPILEDGLRKAILRCGAPKNLYVDNGKIFTSTWMQLACAKLNIRHLKTRPYSPEAKGKIERFNRTVESFLAEYALQQAGTLAELNQLFGAWLSEAYQHKPHSSLGGKTPADTFAADSAPLHFHSLETLADVFLHEADRTVDKTGCLSLGGRTYDAGAEYMRKKVTVRFDPFDRKELQLWYQGERKKNIQEAQIGEYNGTQRVECEKVEQSAESRVLKILAEDHQKRFKKAMGAFQLGTDAEAGTEERTGERGEE